MIRLFNRSLFVHVFSGLVVFFVMSSSSFAARPLTTDDARLTTSGSCQIEAFTKIYKDSTEKWAMPACNPTGNFEITAGVGDIKNTGDPTVKDYVLQAKTLFRELTTDSYGVGLVVGQVNHPFATPGPNELGNTYAFFPLSISTQDDKVIYHINLGWMKDKEKNEQRMTYGLASEIEVSERVTVIAEAYGDTSAKPYWQAGARFTLIPNLFQMDSTIGQQLSGGSSSTWFSFGLRFTPDSIF